MLTFNEKSLDLKDGYTLNDYIIRVNADKVSYCDICQVLKLTFREARAIYDKVWNIPIEAIATPKRLEYLKTGTDWRKH